MKTCEPELCQKPRAVVHVDGEERRGHKEWDWVQVCSSYDRDLDRLLREGVGPPAPDRPLHRRFPGERSCRDGQWSSCGSRERDSTRRDRDRPE